MAVVEISYVALRAVRDARTEAWWSAADTSDSAPPPVLALLAGRSRVELSAPEAEAALAWAATVDSWAGLDPKPLVLHRAIPGSLTR
jgi:hypothetical protein